MDNLEKRLACIEAKIDIMFNPPIRICGCGRRVAPVVWRLVGEKLVSVTVCECGTVHEFYQDVR